MRDASARGARFRRSADVEGAPLGRVVTRGCGPLLCSVMLLAVGALAVEAAPTLPYLGAIGLLTTSSLLPG